MTADLYLTLILIIGICVVFALVYIAYWLRELAINYKLSIMNYKLENKRNGRVEVL